MLFSFDKSGKLERIEVSGLNGASLRLSACKKYTKMTINYWSSLIKYAIVPYEKRSIFYAIVPRFPSADSAAQTSYHSTETSWKAGLAATEVI